MRYYSIDPFALDYDIRYWGDRKVEILKCSFREFLDELSQRIDKNDAALAAVQPRQGHSIARFYTSTETHISDRLSFFLDNSVDHIRPNMKISGRPTPKAFYEGEDVGWGALEAKFDVPRRVSDDILSESVISEIEDEPEGGAQLVLIKGPAGNGKTIALRRIAWDAANDYDKFVLFLKDTGAIDPVAIAEISERTNRRLFLFVDRCALHHDEILELFLAAKREKHSITIITAEREHEWHTYCGALNELPRQDYSIRYLSEKEIHSLLEKLDQYNCLGVLGNVSYEERFRAFYEHAGRQLLVALHELTSGRSFEEIVNDEYNRIIPAEARYLYLDVCSLNRFAVPVRAGSISRISNISFSDFKERLFDPLSNVVHNFYDPNVRDYVYTARHPHVGTIVFETVLDTAEKKFDQMIRILGGLNLAFSTDNIAFREIIRSAGVIDAFPSVELAHRFYDQAIKVTGGLSEYVFQQAAIFELNHDGGTLGRAYQMLKSAIELAPHDPSIQHTYANLRRRQALVAKTELEANTFRQEAREILNRLKRRKNSQVYEFHTLAQISLDELQEALAYRVEEAADNAERRIGDLVTEAEDALQVGLQRFPDSSHLHALEANFHEMLSKSDRAEAALKKAFDLNVRQEFIAVRLARHLNASGKEDDARDILHRCIDAKPGAKFAHLEIARMMLEKDDYDRGIVIGHLRRSTTSGDANYFAQYLLAVQYILDEKEEDAAIIFESLTNSPLSNNEKRKTRWIWKDESGSTKIFNGIVDNAKESYCFLKTGRFKRAVFSHYSDSDPGNWRHLRPGKSVSFKIGFTMRGIVALDIKVKN